MIQPRRKGRGTSWLLVPLLSLVAGAAGLGWGSAPAAIAHGTSLVHRNGIEVEARYDTGAPMGNAQVAVFAPGQPEIPVMTGQTNAEGQFWFVPPATSPTETVQGLAKDEAWEVQVRLAGHGALLKIPVDAISSSASSSLTPLQQGVMGAVGLWGFVGTALFFSRRPGQPSSSVAAPSATVSTTVAATTAPDSA